MNIEFYWDVKNRSITTSLNKNIERANKKFNTDYSVKDFFEMDEQMTKVQSEQTRSKENALVICSSDMHIRKYCVDDENNVLYDKDVLLRRIRRWWSAHERLYLDYGWDKQIGSFHWIDFGDLIDGWGGTFKTQAFQLDKAFLNLTFVKDFLVKEVFLPILTKAKSMFGEVNLTLNPGNHDKLDYDSGDFEYITYDVANRLRSLGFNVLTKEVSPCYIRTDVRGWGFLTTHGHQGVIRNARAETTVKSKLAILARDISDWNYFGSGHLHCSKELTRIAGQGKDDLKFFRCSTPVTGDRHGANFDSGDHTWWSFIVNPKYGIISGGMPFDLSDEGEI